MHIKYRSKKLGGIYAGDYNEVLTYIHHHFIQIVRELRGLESKYSEEIANLVKQLCNPDSAQRGHPVDIKRGRNQYNLERYITTFDRLARKAESSLTQKRN